MGGHTAAHRLAADEDWHPRCPLPRNSDGFSERCLEYGCPIWHLPPFSHVRKVKRHDGDAFRGQRLRHTHHERMALPRARPVRQHQQGAGIASRLVTRRADSC